jgi:hypothetical protein
MTDNVIILNGVGEVKGAMNCSLPPHQEATKNIPVENPKEDDESKELWICCAQCLCELLFGFFFC